jgi:hypothetical protein
MLMTIITEKILRILYLKRGLIFLRIVNPIKADEKVIKTFHSQEYVEYVKFCTDEPDEEKIFNQSRDDFGIG